jgi:hypothetical protein
MKIKNYIWLVLVIGFTGTQVAAQRVPSKPAQGLSASESAAAVDTSLETTCNQRRRKISRKDAHNPQVFSAERIEKTLTGVWHGRVSGNYEKQFLAGDGFVNVDYYLIVDAKRGEALVFEQFGDKRAAPVPKPGAPVWSYVTCGRENYTPRHPAQVHEFFKVSDNVEDARAILKTSTGLTFEDKGELVLSEVWKQLVEAKYFDDPERALAYAGGFFSPFKFQNVPVQGGSLVDMYMKAEYRGSGMTAARFERGVPIHGIEKGKFLGVTTYSPGNISLRRSHRARQGIGGGDFLVASSEAGSEVEAEKAEEEAALNSAPRINMAFDKVVIGPLAPAADVSSRGKSRTPR